MIGTRDKLNCHSCTYYILKKIGVSVSVPQLFIFKGRFKLKIHLCKEFLKLYMVPCQWLKGYGETVTYCTILNLKIIF